MSGKRKQQAGRTAAVLEMLELGLSLGCIATVVERNAGHVSRILRNHGSDRLRDRRRKIKQAAFDAAVKSARKTLAGVPDPEQFKPLLVTAYEAGLSQSVLQNASGHSKGVINGALFHRGYDRRKRLRALEKIAATEATCALRIAKTWRKTCKDNPDDFKGASKTQVASRQHPPAARARALPTRGQPLAGSPTVGSSQAAGLLARITHPAWCPADDHYILRRRSVGQSFGTIATALDLRVIAVLQRYHRLRAIPDAQTLLKDVIGLSRKPYVLPQEVAT